ncbi:MAG: hypothetical protein ACK5S9_09220 [Roseiflexaceae bacterium]|jgi:hypothetical protein
MSQKALLTIFAAFSLVGIISCAALMYANVPETRVVIKTVSVQVGIWPSDTPTATLSPTPTLTPTIDPRIAARACLGEITIWAQSMTPFLQYALEMDKANNSGNMLLAFEYMKYGMLGIGEIKPPACNDDIRTVQYGYIEFFNLYNKAMLLEAEGDTTGARAKIVEAAELGSSLTKQLTSAFDTAKNDAGTP